jgi:hypothetical protein
MTASKPLYTLMLLIALFVFISQGAVGIFLLAKAGSSHVELLVALVIITGIATLLTVLFILAAGFNAMALTDRTQALGLPEGSIRAIIALVLILVFILFGIYLFRVVGTDFTTNRVSTVTDPAQARIPSDKVVIFEPKPGATPNAPSEYWVVVVEPLSADAKRLAQQLLTTIGTLVVSIASFYFGSTLTRTGTKGERDTSAIPPVISQVTPKEAGPGDHPLEIVGTGFKSPSVRLVRGSETLPAKDVVADAATIRCQITVDKESKGDWDLVVENEDGGTAMAKGRFIIT